MACVFELQQAQKSIHLGFFFFLLQDPTVEETPVGCPWGESWPAVTDGEALGATCGTKPGRGRLGSPAPSRWLSQPPPWICRAGQLPCTVVTFPCTFSSPPQRGRDRSRCRAQVVSNHTSTPWQRDVHLSLSSTACASLGRNLSTEVSTMALGAPSRAVIAPSNPSLCVQSQRVKCRDSVAAGSQREGGKLLWRSLLQMSYHACWGWSGVPVSSSRHRRPVECHSTAKTPVPGGNGRQPGLEIAPAISRFLGDSRNLSAAQELGLDGWRGALFFLEIILYYLVWGFKGPRCFESERLGDGRAPPAPSTFPGMKASLAATGSSLQLLSQ
ncbi:uncharacterized protein LOC129210966 [Grus americana]|uniref:uncharacterized protein LOC129210966 n=1 Tax=Grus americana TaxID=9117 RepID=UPI002407C554|nr:uncharacterized protein LOC129210966 [Grus americana]